MSEAIVRLRNVDKRYTRGKQSVEVLQGLTLDIPKGEFVALMGPSGSGKTTLLNLIGGLDTPTAGEITVAGQRLDQLGSGALARWRANHVGFVFQFYNLMPMLSAQRNVECWSPIRRSWSATNPPAISTANPPTTCCISCRC